MCPRARHSAERRSESGDPEEAGAVVSTFCSIGLFISALNSRYLSARPGRRRTISQPAASTRNHSGNHAKAVAVSLAVQSVQTTNAKKARIAQHITTPPGIL